MAMNNPRVIGYWVINAGATVELIKSTSTTPAATSIWPTGKFNLELGATTASNWGFAFGMPTPTVFIPRFGGGVLTANATSGIGSDTTNNTGSIWVNNPGSVAITIYALVFDEMSTMN